MHYSYNSTSLILFSIILFTDPAYLGLFTSSLLSCSPQDGVIAPTPLIAASGKNHIEVARFLIKHGASIDYQNQVLISFFFCFLICSLKFSQFLFQNGYSALQVACIRGNTDIVKLLIRFNANIELKNKVSLVLAYLIIIIIIHHDNNIIMIIILL